MGKILAAKSEDLLVKFTEVTWRKIQAWVGMTTKEISGMGLVKQEDNELYVYDVFLIEQENTSSYTDIDDTALLKLFNELLSADDADNGDRIDNFKFWFHSHANMGVFWSGTDDGCIEKVMQSAPWFVSAVFNREGAVRVRMDLKTPRIKIDDLTWKIERLIPDEIMDFCKKEFEEKVKESKAWNNNYSKGYWKNESPVKRSYGDLDDDEYLGYWGYQGWRGNQVFGNPTKGETKKSDETKKLNGTNMVDSSLGLPKESQVELVRKYAKSQTKEALLTRISNWILLLERKELLRLLNLSWKTIWPDLTNQGLALSIAARKPNQILQTEILKIAEDNPVETFVEIWLKMKFEAFCCECKEPLSKDAKVCPECREVLEVPIPTPQIYNYIGD